MSGIATLERQGGRLKDLRALVLTPLRLFFGAQEASRQVELRARLAPLLRQGGRQWRHRDRRCAQGSRQERAQRGGIASLRVFAQRARAVPTAMIDPADPRAKRPPKTDRHLLTKAGSNLGPAQVELAYKIGGAEVKGLATSRIVWRG